MFPTPMTFEEAGWDKPEHRYTYNQVRAMDRAEFDHRLDLHSIYANDDMFNTDYIRAKYPDARHPLMTLRVTKDERLGAMHRMSGR